MDIDLDVLGYRQVLADDSFCYGCSSCGECCRNVKGTIMVNSLDLYKAAQFLGIEMGDACLQYTEIKALARGFPVLMLKTRQHRDAYIFLKSSRCSIHDAKPHICRAYPIAANPDGEKTGELLYAIDFANNRHHFAGCRHRVGDWINNRLSIEERQYIVEDSCYLRELAILVRDIDAWHEEEVMRLIMLYKYIFYEMADSFFPQYRRNMQQLKRRLKELGGKRE